MEINIGMSECHKNVDNYYGSHTYYGLDPSLRRPRGFRRCRAPSWLQIFFLPISLTAHPDYINTRMEDHSWYVGQMDRPSAGDYLTN